MLEPQSTFLFIILVVIFAGMMWWMIRTRRAVLRVVASFVAFVVAVQFGIMAVNRYFDYYQTWGAAFADLTNAPPPKGAVGTSGVTVLSKGHGLLSGQPIVPAIAQQQGFQFEATLPGRLSHISRYAYIYLPAQYFQSAYRNYRFPVIELVHGQPGEPQDWINVMGVVAIMDGLVSRGLAKPAVLVMPDANGGTNVSEQCLNQVHGQQDMTYLGLDVPNYVSAELPRVQAPGLGWGIAGYSEGGYCAANMALQPMLSRRYGASGVLSGYFTPYPNFINGKNVNPFGKNYKLRLLNTPDYEVKHLLPGQQIPQFWIGAGSGDKQDLDGASYFWNELSLYQAGAPLKFQPGGHTMAVWRSQISPMLEWMTPLLEQNALKLDRIAQLAALHSRECAADQAGHPKSDPAGTTSPTGLTTPSPGAGTKIPAFCHQKTSSTKPPAKKSHIKIKAKRPSKP
jgi:enterochelin esterase-like enzyme